MGAWKLAVLVFGLAATLGTTIQNQTEESLDVLICVIGADLRPDTEGRARTNLRRIFDRIGVRVSWVNRQPKFQVLPLRNLDVFDE